MFWLRKQFLQNKRNLSVGSIQGEKNIFEKKSSPTGSRTRVSRVKAEYHNHLDYRGEVHVLSTGIEPATLGL